MRDEFGVTVFWVCSGLCVVCSHIGNGKGRGKKLASWRGTRYCDVVRSTQEVWDGVHFPGYFSVHIRGFHDLLRQKPSSLFILYGWSSISMASLMMRSIILFLWRVWRCCWIEYGVLGGCCAKLRPTCPDIPNECGVHVLSIWCRWSGQSALSQKMIIIIVTAVETSNLTHIYFFSGKTHAEQAAYELAIINTSFTTEISKPWRVIADERSVWR
jgi:hypothetical protein